MRFPIFRKFNGDMSRMHHFVASNLKSEEAKTLAVIHAYNSKAKQMWSDQRAHSISMNQRRAEVKRKLANAKSHRSETVEQAKEKKSKKEESILANRQSELQAIYKKYEPILGANEQEFARVVEEAKAQEDAVKDDCEKETVEIEKESKAFSDSFVARNNEMLKKANK